jgi:hypothetical protein
MMIIPFEPDHLKRIDLQEEQSTANDFMNNLDYIEALSAHEAWTGLIDGRVVACAGFVTIWAGRIQVWSVVSATIGAKGMMVLTRAVLRGLALKKGRVEAIVADNFKAGHRWARMLGFTLETPVAMRGFFPNGGDAFLYARVG